MNNPTDIRRSRQWRLLRERAFLWLTLLTVWATGFGCSNGNQANNNHCEQVTEYRNRGGVILRGMQCGGKREGLWIANRKNVKEIQATAEFRNGIPYGRVRLFGLYGRLETSFNIGLSGHLDGPFETYDPYSPELSMVGEFLEDRPIGLWKWYFDSGELYGYQYFSQVGIEEVRLRKGKPLTLLWNPPKQGLYSKYRALELFGVDVTPPPGI